jgi:UrcA family protein
MISVRLPAAFAIGSCALLLASVLVTPRVAYAESSDRPSSRIVRFADLNLDSRAGIEALYRRIQSAARNVCGPAEDLGSRRLSPAWQSCTREAVMTAVRRVDRPLLTAYYDERGGHGIGRIPATRIAGSGSDR